MKKLLLLFIFSSLFVSLSAKDTYSRGYFKKNGTYVQPYFKTKPNKTKRDNYASKGNINPYTGKKGSKKYND